ncbi:hypothetical protein Golob_022626 [Gossypium lobatum]|uniref:Uncharacterized protein n=1 Tax=Gossypium lobatum TaxID=34289 RepID=A0A7J8LH89_9ROSI|nr:hypothetical protein [Gossypium lobatum]
MVVDLDPILTLSSKDKLLGKGVANFGEVVVGSDGGSDVEIDFFEGDVTRSTSNRIPTIDFSDRIQQILFKEMAMTVVLKLLGRSIGYVSLQNRITKPTSILTVPSIFKRTQLPADDGNEFDLHGLGDVALLGEASCFAQL